MSSTPSTNQTYDQVKATLSMIVGFVIGKSVSAQSTIITTRKKE